MNRKEFLETLESRLNANNYKETKNVIAFYEELIADKIESGKKESVVIKELGNIDAILQNLSLEEKLSTAKEKPTISNGFKAVFAVLGVLSAPILIPLGIALVSLLFALVIIIIALIISIGCGVLGSFVGLGVLLANLINHGMPVSTFIFSTGVFLVLLGILSQLFLWSILLPKKFIILTVKNLEKAINKRKGQLK